jgi:hypothetical protein
LIGELTGMVKGKPVDELARAKDRRGAFRIGCALE